MLERDRRWQAGPWERATKKAGFPLAPVSEVYFLCTCLDVSSDMPPFQVPLPASRWGASAAPTTYPTPCPVKPAQREHTTCPPQPLASAPVALTAMTLTLPTLLPPLIGTQAPMCPASTFSVSAPTSTLSL
jgi:hypothetical protein